MKKILFLTTHNFATNPRLVKEIRLAILNKFKVEVICFEFNNWSYEFNQQIKDEFTSAGAVLHILQAERKPFTKWLQSVATEKIARWVSRFVMVKNHVLSNGVSRRSKLILVELKKIKNADWVIGHNPGALWPTLKAAEKFKCKAGFDVEDYHPGEGYNVLLQQLTKRLMQQVLPQMDYVSFAAPLIRKEVGKDLGGEGKNWITVFNYFSGGEFTKPAVVDGPLKLVWFSQNIGAGRGLEFVLPAVNELGNEVELHLFGNMHAAFNETTIKGNSNIYLHAPLQQAALHHELRNFDIGLALEPAKDQNNDLAISNKLLAYLQAGLYVLGSNTLSQIDYLNKCSANGVSVNIKQNAEIETALKKLITEKNIIRAGKINRFQDFRKMNWESESKKLMNIL